MTAGTVRTAESTPLTEAPSDVTPVSPADKSGLPAGEFVFLANVRQATALLALGAGLILVGLFVSLAVTPGPIWLPTASAPELQLNMYGEPFPSGWPYVPTSVSATINDPETASGRIFQASVLTGAIMILISNYPSYLSNVYFGQTSAHGYPIINSLRAYVIPMGIIIVSLCPVADVNMTTTAMNIALYGFHMTGALSAIIVFCVCEWHDLTDSSIQFVPYEKIIRQILFWGVVISTVTFILGEALGTLPTTWTGICCFDTYLEVNQTAIDSAKNNEAHIQLSADLTLRQLHKLLVAKDGSSDTALYKGLYDTAYGLGLAVRVMGVWGEAFVFFSMLWSYIAVWYFCPERRNPVPSHKGYYQV